MCGEMWCDVGCRRRTRGRQTRNATISVCVEQCKGVKYQRNVRGKCASAVVCAVQRVNEGNMLRGVSSRDVRGVECGEWGPAGNAEGVVQACANGM